MRGADVLTLPTRHLPSLPAAWRIRVSFKQGRSFYDVEAASRGLVTDGAPSTRKELAARIDAVAKKGWSHLVVSWPDLTQALTDELTDEMTVGAALAAMKATLVEAWSERDGG